MSKMENKYWILIIAAIILLTAVAIFITYKTTSERWYGFGYNEGEGFGYVNGYAVGYKDKNCKICIDNYDKGYEDGEQKCISCVIECHYKYYSGGSRLLICLRGCGIKNAGLLYPKYVS